MEDLDIEELRKIKANLTKRLHVLQNRLKKRERRTSLNSGLSNTSDVNKSKDVSPVNFKNGYIDISHKITGMAFEDVNKKWLRDKLYQYTATVKTETIHFFMELIVNLKNESFTEIAEIVCHFINVEQHYMLEIIPWVQSITKMKNFSLLVFVISDYNDYNIIRSKIVHALHAQNYITYKECMEDDGGLLIYLRSPKNKEQVYIEFQWSLKFVTQMWHIDHIFQINCLDNGVEFFNKNCDLLNEFCQLHLTKKNINKLWSNLCIAVDDYEEQNIISTES